MARSRPRLLSAVLCSAVILLTAACGTESADTKDAPAAAPAAVDEQLQAKVPSAIRDAGVITIATPFDNPPSISTNEDGTPSGIAYELGEQIAAVLGLKAEWHELAFPGVIPGLQSGKFDLSMGVIGDTAERQEILDFVDLMVNESTLLVKAGNPAELTDLASACGKTIGVLAGSLQLAAVQDESKACTQSGKDSIDINEYSATRDAQAQVASGRADAYLAPFLVLSHTAKTAGGGNMFELTDAAFPDNPWAIAMQKDRGTLAEAVRGALEKLVAEGIYLEILEKYDAARAALSPDQVLINGAGTPAFTG